MSVKHVKYMLVPTHGIITNPSFHLHLQKQQRANILSSPSSDNLRPFHQTTVPMRVKPTTFRLQKDLNRGHLENQNYHYNKYYKRSKIRRIISSEYIRCWGYIPSVIPLLFISTRR